MGALKKLPAGIGGGVSTLTLQHYLDVDGAAVRAAENNAFRRRMQEWNQLCAKLGFPVEGAR